jgi:hypothetical protein
MQCFATLQRTTGCIVRRLLTGRTHDEKLKQAIRGLAFVKHRHGEFAFLPRSGHFPPYISDVRREERMRAMLIALATTAGLAMGTTTASAQVTPVNYYGYYGYEPCGPSCQRHRAWRGHHWWSHRHYHHYSHYSEYHNWRYRHYGY